MIQFLAADISADNLKEVGNWLQIAFFLVGGAIAAVLGALKIKQMVTKPEPLQLQQPVTFTAMQNPVTRAEFDDLKRKVESTETKMDTLTKDVHAMHLDLIEKGQARERDITERINVLIQAVRTGRKTT